MGVSRRACVRGANGETGPAANTHHIARPGAAMTTEMESRKLMRDTVGNMLREVPSIQAAIDAIKARCEGDLTRYSLEELIDCLHGVASSVKAALASPLEAADKMGTMGDRASVALAQARAMLDKAREDAQDGGM